MFVPRIALLSADRQECYSWLSPFALSFLKPKITRSLCILKFEQELSEAALAQTGDKAALATSKLTCRKSRFA
jgi:hypothetical protein